MSNINDELQEIAGLLDSADLVNTVRSIAVLSMKNRAIVSDGSYKRRSGYDAVLRGVFSEEESSEFRRNASKELPGYSVDRIANDLIGLKKDK